MEEARPDLRPALQTWLTEHLEGTQRVEVGEFDRPHGGFSAETIIVPATVTRDGVTNEERFVLRLETAEDAVYPQQVDGLTTEVDIQYRVMQQVQQHGRVPIAPLLGYEADTSVLGTEFFVMGFVDGEIPGESPMYTIDGFFTECDPAQRRTLLDNGVGVMADIHAVDLDAADLGWLRQPGEEPDARRQLRLWSEYAARELGDREHPSMTNTFAWLDANLPPASEPVLNWGDARPGNVIWQEFAPACVTDFEAASIAPREVDLGWWLMFDHWAHETIGAPRLDGEPTRDEQRQRYLEATGLGDIDTYPWEVFAAARYCAIVVRVMNRLVQRGDLPPDHTIWLDNPASVCLDLYRAEGGL